MFGLAMLLEVYVNVDCRNQNDRFHNILPRRRHIHHLQSGSQTGDNQRADQGAMNGANST
jgi:hypothetical protein